MMMDCLCRPSRIMSVRINLLDETDFIHEIKDDLPGQALLDVVFARLNLIETSYFGIRYIDEENQTHWLDPASRISRQLKPKADAYDLYFGVKFYAADPCKLLEEITRYQLFLQVKQDVLQGRLPVAFELAAELGAFVVQSELGDYDQRRHSKGYVSEFRLLPNQSSELETRVSELHQQLKGMSPATAELNYLDKVKWHDMYGVDLHPVLGEDSVEYFLGLTPSGIVVLRNKTTVAHYYWPRIAKVYYKGRYFMLRISDKNNDLSTYGFETPRKSACKHLWRCCVEHHAFFRLVRVAPLPNSQSNASELFQIGTRLRYSGRSTEKQSIKDALSIGRTPPVFTRVPSKRQPRRVIDEFLNGGSKSVETYSNVGTLLGGVGGGKGGAGIMTTNYESPYRSTYSIPTSLGIRPYQQQPLGGPSQTTNGNYNGSNLQTPDSPRSTRSAPWPRSQQRSLFGNNPSSPRSVRSARTARTSSSGGGGGGSGSAHHHSNHHNHHHQHHNGNNHHNHQSEPQSQHSRSQHDQHVPSQRYRSSSVESHSSNDSRSTRRHKNRHRRTSDNESELSRGSGRSGRSHHRKHRRSRHRHESAGSDHESTRGRSYSGHRSSSQRSGSAELIDSTTQWREVQRRQAEASLGQSSVQQASVSKSSMVARSLHSNDSHSDTHSHHKSRHRHRSKNKSPSDSRSRIWSSELAKHLQFDLVDTTGMSEDQLREIPYTVVETNSKRSTSNLKIHKSNSKSSVGGKSNGSGNTLTNGSGSMNGQGKNRVDRIRGLYYQNSNPTENGTAKNGSIRSASTISSRECERNSGLVRMMSSMSMGDFISPTGSNLSPLENSALRVSHEHTDSGLGADQDYAYSSERSSDSTRYGTNKSSGASSGSHRKTAGVGSTTTAYNSLIQQSVSNQQQQQQQKMSQRQNAHSFYGPQRAHQKSSNSSTKTLAPIHNLLASSNSSTSPPAGSAASIKNQQATTSTIKTTSSSTSPPTTKPTNNSISSRNANESKKGAGSKHHNTSAGNRLLNYTTFENNQYKFSLNNVFGKSATSNGNGNGNSNANAPHGGGGMGRINNPIDSFPEWPNNPAAPYYYSGPSTSNTNNMKRRDAKSDIGVRTRRLSGGQSSMGSGTAAITKTQLLSGHFGNGSGCYPLQCPDGSAYTSRLNGGSVGGALHPAKSDLFLSYIHTAASAAGEYERPYIYNYKMPQMPDFLRTANSNQQQQPKGTMQPPPPPHQSNTAYHISGSQTADPPQLYKPSDASGGGAVTATTSAAGIYGGATPATDVMYYQFDNGRPPIVQQPKSLLSKATNSGAGPLVYVQHGQIVAPANATATQQTTTCTTTNTTTAPSTSTNSTTHSQNNNQSPCAENGNEHNNHDDEAEDVFAEVNYVNDDDDDDYAEFDDGFKVEDPNFHLNNINNQINNHNGSNNNGSSSEHLASPCGSNAYPMPPLSTGSLCVNANVQADGSDNCIANANGNSTFTSLANEQQYQQHCTINNPNSSNSATVTPTFNPVAVTNSNNWNANSTLNGQQQSPPLPPPPLQQQQQQQQHTTQNFHQNPNSNRNHITVDHTQNSNTNSYAYTNSNSIAMQNQNPNISSSLEIILSPIIQSSRRAQ